MNDLPIRLVWTVVDLGGAVGERWTLGPTWYEDHKHDDEIVPFYDSCRQLDDVDRNVDRNVASDDVKIWATKMINNTTCYCVVGWNGLVPALMLENHIVEFWTMAGGRTSYSMNGETVQGVIDSLNDPDAVIVIPRPELPNTTTRIPVRAIATVNHSRHRAPVANI